MPGASHAFLPKTPVRTLSPVYVPSAFRNAWDGTMGLGIRGKLTTAVPQLIQVFPCTAAGHGGSLTLSLIQISRGTL